MDGAYYGELKSGGIVKESVTGSFGYVAAWAEVNSPLYEDCEVVIRRVQDGYDQKDM